MFRRSLALRIFIINCLLLILPTFIWLGYFYEKSRQEGIDDALSHMRDLAFARISRIEAHIAFSEDMLTIISHKIDIINTPEDQLATEFQRIINTVPIFDNIFYTKVNAEGRFLVEAANFSSHNLDMTAQIFSDPKKPQNGFTIGKNPNNSLSDFITKILTDKEGKVVGALSFGFSPQTVLKRVINTDNTSLGATFTLVPQNQAPTQDTFMVTEEGVHYIGVLLPIENSHVVLLVKTDKAFILSPLLRHIWKSLILVALLFCISCLIIWALVRRLSKPLHQFMDLIQNVANNQLAERYKKDDVGYEINDLGDAVNRMLSNLLVQIEAIKNEPIKQQLVAEELRISHQIQQTLLPQRLPPLSVGLLAAKAIPALDVGGDFYDVFQQPGKLFLSVADGAGKGIPACLYSLALRSMLRSYAVSSNNVATILEEANNLFCQDTEVSAMFVTIFMAYLDTTTQRLDYYSAGHLPVLIKHADGQIEKLWNEGTPLGVALVHDLQQKSVQLQQGDLLLFYTDGVTEAMNPSGELYGEERLMAFLQNCPAQTPELIIDALITDIENYEAGARRNDDITILLLQLNEHQFDPSASSRTR